MGAQSANVTYITHLTSYQQNMGVFTPTLNQYTLFDLSFIRQSSQNYCCPALFTPKIKDELSQRVSSSHTTFIESCTASYSYCSSEMEKIFSWMLPARQYPKSTYLVVIFIRSSRGGRRSSDEDYETVSIELCFLARPRSDRGRLVTYLRTRFSYIFCYKVAVIFITPFSYQFISHPQNGKIKTKHNQFLKCQYISSSMLCRFQAQITKLCRGGPISSVKNLLSGPETILWLEYPTRANPKHLVFSSQADYSQFLRASISCWQHYWMVMNLGGSQIFLSFKIFYSVLSLTLMSTSTKVCRSAFLFFSILGQKLSGFHFSVHSGTETTSPNRYTCKPVHPTALIILALWMTYTLMPSLTARRQRSEWVVAQKASPTTKNAKFNYFSWDILSSTLSISTSQKSRSASMMGTCRYYYSYLLEVLMTEVQYSRYTSLQDRIAFRPFMEISSGWPRPSPIMQNTINNTQIQLINRLRNSIKQSYPH